MMATNQPSENAEPARDLLAEVMQAAQQIYDSRRIILCHPHNRADVDAAIETYGGVSGLIEVQETTFLPYNTIAVIDPNAVEKMIRDRPLTMFSERVLSDTEDRTGVPCGWPNEHCGRRGGSASCTGCRYDD